MVLYVFTKVGEKVFFSFNCLHLLPPVAMYLGIRKGKLKPINPAPSDSLGV